MKSFLRLCCLPATLLMFLDACTVQDHQPSTPNCQIRTLDILEKSSFWEVRNKDEIFELDGQQIPIGKARSYSYQFDEQNRLIERQYYRFIGSTVDQRTTYEYSPTAVTRKVYNFGSPEPVAVDVFPVNERGLWARTGLSYDSEGYLIEDTNESGTTNYIIENGNVVRIEYRSTPGGAVNSYRTFAYNLSKPNIGYVEPEFMGKASRNLLIQEEDHAGDGSVTSRVDYHYLFDSEGRPTRRYTDFVENGNTYYTILDFTITCR
ncbi:hypothetical protein ACO2Q8_00395 [Larkinella sp. VNQ87]|uniref:hypothetical protein n=1 Tax=Larkinella sp. VNQ87 TaxID=3400921 RepID=UPI003C00BB13